MPRKIMQAKGRAFVKAGHGKKLGRVQATDFKPCINKYKYLQQIDISFYVIPGTGHVRLEE